MTARCCLLLLLVSTLPCRADELKAGAAAVDITPPIGHPMWGYAARRDAPCVGVRDKLHARALVLEVGKHRLALVGLDLGRPPTRTSTAAIRDKVSRAGGIGTLFLVASHTHHAPLPPGRYQWRYRFATMEGKTSDWSVTRAFSVAADAVSFPMPTRAQQRERVQQVRDRRSQGERADE